MYLYTEPEDEHQKRKVQNAKNARKYWEKNKDKLKTLEEENKNLKADIKELKFERNFFKEQLDNSRR